MITLSSRSILVALVATLAACTSASPLPTDGSSLDAATCHYASNADLQTTEPNLSAPACASTYEAALMANGCNTLNVPPPPRAGTCGSMLAVHRMCPLNDVMCAYDPSSHALLGIQQCNDASTPPCNGCKTAGALNAGTCTFMPADGG